MSGFICRLSACTSVANCAAAGACMSVEEHAHEYRAFLTGDAMPALRHILKMLDDGSPAAHVRVEVHALLQRAARTV